MEKRWNVRPLWHHDDEPRPHPVVQTYEEPRRVLALAGHAQAAVPLAEELEQSMEARGLADWQPELCLEALCVCHTVWSAQETPEARARAAAIAAAICRIRPSRSPFL